MERTKKEARRESYAKPNLDTQDALPIVEVMKHVLGQYPAMSAQHGH